MIDDVIDDVIEDVIARWHRYMAGELPGGLGELLSDDVVFYSPVVYTPQRGKAITMQYLPAASQALAGGDGGEFRYTKQDGAPWPATAISPGRATPAAPRRTAGPR